MKTDKQNITKAKSSVSVRRNNTAESVIDRIVGHLILAALLLIFGLVFTDRWGFRGFPFGWFHAPQFTRYDRLIASFLVLLTVTVCADLIAAAIGRIKEPAMKVVENKAPRSISAETVVVPADKVSQNSVRKPAAPRMMKTPAKPAAGNRSFGNTKGKNKISALIWVVVGITILSFIGTSVDDNDYDTDYDDNTYEDSYEYEETLTDIADNIMYRITWGDYESISGLGDTKPIEELGDLGDYEVELFKDTYYSTDDKEHAVFKYIMYEDRDDENAAVYLAGIQIGGDVDESFPKDTKVEGFTIYKFGSHDEFSKFYESDDGEISIDKDKCVSLGEVEADNMFILNMH